MSDLEFDFGFTAVDTEEFTRSTTVVSVPSTPIVAEVSDEQMLVISKKISDLSAQITALKSTFTTPTSTTSSVSVAQVTRVEEKIDRILGMELQELNSTISQQGDSLGAMFTEIELRKNQIENECKEKLKEVENLILPLLTNLMKNPEKEYIHWPRRSEKIQTQIDKITRCTRIWEI